MTRVDINRLTHSKVAGELAAVDCAVCCASPLLIAAGVLTGAGAVLFFFFQAEDGIRDVAVTGVQTCALPISGGDTADDADRFAVFSVGVFLVRHCGYFRPFPASS